MAEDSGNEDQWLYGDSNQEPPESENKEKQKVEALDETVDITKQSENTSESEQVLNHTQGLKG
jgi:hypothetical protein